MKAKTLFLLYYILILLTGCAIGQLQEEIQIQNKSLIQDEAQNYILLIKNNNVKSRTKDKDRVFEYRYSGSTIIEMLSQNDNQFVRRFHLNERNQIDSIIPGIENDNNSFSYNEYYYYNTKNQLIKKEKYQYFISFIETREFIYNRLGNLDTIYQINISKGINSEKIEIDTNYTHFIYDAKNRLALKKSNIPTNFEEVHYQYDSKGRVKSETQDYGYGNKGLTSMEDKLIIGYLNSYHSSGYREKQIENVYGIKPDGTKDKITIQTNYYHKNGLLKKAEREPLASFLHKKNLKDEYEYSFYEN